MNLNVLLQKAVEEKASDVHLCVGLPPIFRVHGELVNMGGASLSPQDCLTLAKECLNERNFATFLENGEIDSAYALPGICRFRVNVFKQRGTPAIALRAIPTEIPDLSTLGLPETIRKFAEMKRGLILVTGPTGSGKTTTLASMINHINKTKGSHIITVEDPIEFTYKHGKSVINQREIGTDSLSFANSLRGAMRQDPDVILVGEMRDQETISTALTAAETGHLVMSTLHTVGAPKTIDRIIDVFPPHQQSQVRSQLSTILQAVVSQQLIKTVSGEGRVAATEIMTLTPAIANLIREGKTPQISSSIHTGAQYGMHSMDSNIAQLYKEGKIDYQSASDYAVDQDNLKKLIAIDL